MKTIIKKYKIKEIWHFTDMSNLEVIEKHKGIFSIGEIVRRGISVPAPGGNDWSHDADRIKGVSKYVHLAFIDDHPMLFRAKKDGRITAPIWLRVDSSIMLGDSVRFTSDVSNKSGVTILQPEEAIEEIDWEVLFTRTDWRNPEIQARRMAAKKSEILVPEFVPIEKVLDYKDG